MKFKNMIIIIHLRLKYFTVLNLVTKFNNVKCFNLRLFIFISFLNLFISVFAGPVCHPQQAMQDTGGQ